MENVYFDVETDSTIENVVDPSDHADFRAHAPDNVQEPILAGSLNAVTAGLQTDADARQAAAPDAGQCTEGFELFRDPAASQPSVTVEAAASRHGTEQSAVVSSGVTHFGPHSLASGGMFMDQGGDRGRELGGLIDPCLSQQHFERAVTSLWGESTPMTTVLTAQTSMTSTYTSTSVASSAVGGPAHALYARGPPPVGLTSVHPARQVFLLQPVDPRGSTPRAWPGPSARRAELGNLENIWRDSSARSDLRSEFDRSHTCCW